MADGDQGRGADRAAADRDPGVPAAGHRARTTAGCCGSRRAGSAAATSSSIKGNLGGQWLPLVPGHEPLGIIEEVSARGGRAVGRPARRPGGGGDPDPVPVLRPVPGRAVHVVPEPDRQPRRLAAAVARARAVGRVRRVHPPAPERDPAQGPRRHPGRGGGDVQPAGRGRAVGRSPGRGGPGRHGADPRGRAARAGRGAGLARGAARGRSS